MYLAYKQADYLLRTNKIIKLNKKKDKSSISLLFIYTYIRPGVSLIVRFYNLFASSSCTNGNCELSLNKGAI